MKSTENAGFPLQADREPRFSDYSETLQVIQGMSVLQPEGETVFPSAALEPLISASIGFRNAPKGTPGWILEYIRSASPHRFLLHAVSYLVGAVYPNEPEDMIHVIDDYGDCWDRMEDVIAANNYCPPSSTMTATAPGPA